MKQLPVATSVAAPATSRSPEAAHISRATHATALAPNKGYFILKRLLDIIVGCVLLIPLLIMMVIVGSLIGITDGFPMLYSLEAVGKDGKRFRVYKFRTMQRDADVYFASRPEEHAAFQREMKLPNDPRVLPLGRWLRRTSIDELPQIINVLRGEMSLVGPRYVRPEELILYGEFAEERLTMVPGITGLWQINGRNTIPYQQRIIFDRTYLYTRTLLGDIVILIRTIPAVLRGKGAF